MRCDRTLFSAELILHFTRLHGLINQKVTYWKGQRLWCVSEANSRFVCVQRHRPASGTRRTAGITEESPSAAKRDI
jgi:hypothetical protein